MSFRSNRQNFPGISPWLQGCPPNMMPQQDHARNTMVAQSSRMQEQQRGLIGSAPTMNQNMSNQLVNQLSLANTLLSNAFGSKPQTYHQLPPQTNNLFEEMNKRARNATALFGNLRQSGGSLLGNPPSNLNFTTQMTGRKAITTHVNLGHHNSGNSKRMRYNNDNQRGNLPHNRNQSRYVGGNQSNRHRSEYLNRKPRERQANTVTTVPKMRAADNKPKESIENDKAKKVEAAACSDKVTDSAYDPASPTNDNEAEKQIVDETSQEPKIQKTVQKQTMRSPSPSDDAPKTTLQVTIQQGSKGRSVCKDGETGAVSSLKGPNFCHACNVAFDTQEKFHRHMNSRAHKAKMDSLITLHEVKMKQLEAEMKVSEHLRKENVDESASKSVNGRGNYCTLCRSRYTGSKISHLQSKSHKACEEDLNSGKNDEQCKESAASDDPSKDDEEMEETNEIIVPSEESVVSKDDTEMDLASEATVEPSKNDDIPEAVADAVTKETSSAIDTSKKKVVTAKSDANSKKTSTNRGNAASEVSKTKYAKIDEYDPDVEVGAEFVVPLSGLFCKLCRKFYRDTELVKVHCKSQTHYLNFLANKKNSSPKQKAAKDQEQAKTSPKASAADSKGLKQEKDDVLADLHIKKDLAEGETLFDDETFPHSESVASSCSAADEAQEPAEEPKVVVKRNRSVPTPDKKLSPVKRSTRRKKNQ